MDVMIGGKGADEDVIEEESESYIVGLWDEVYDEGGMEVWTRYIAISQARAWLGYGVRTFFFGESPTMRGALGAL